ncbi:MAG: hypothetical protein SFW35_01205 [Chitinophagales bacterium]|nr:hypothetical protein [Chitinophagales bacterium]
MVIESYTIATSVFEVIWAEEADTYASLLRVPLDFVEGYYLRQGNRETLLEHWDSTAAELKQCYTMEPLDDWLDHLQPAYRSHSLTGLVRFCNQMATSSY